MFRVLISPSSLKREGSGLITGLLAVDLGGATFPDKDWWDCPIVVVGWWLRALQDVQTGRAATLSFMEGPHKVSVSPPVDGVSQITFWSGSSRAQPVQVGSVVSGELVRSISAAAEVLASECQQRGWGGEDVVALSSVIN